MTSDPSADGGDKRRAFDSAVSEWLAARAAIETPGERSDGERTNCWLGSTPQRLLS